MMHTDLMRFEDKVHASQFFDKGDVTLARAPGRLDVMGGIADYSGSLVAEMPISAVCCVAAQLSPKQTIMVRTENSVVNGLDSDVTFPLDACADLVSLRHYINGLPASQKWAGYVVGSVFFATDAGFLPAGQGWMLYVSSAVPVGAGVSSSAAVEVASMRAACGAARAEMDAITMARLCQRVENDLLDAPCGIMDQVTCISGVRDALLRLHCQPHTIEGTSAFRENWAVVGLDSGVKHAVSGNGYKEARVGAFMGYEILKQRGGNAFDGYLCNCNLDWYHALTSVENLPERILGSEFLSRYGAIADTVTTVRPEISYRVRAATEHPIMEDIRVRSFLDCVDDASDEAFKIAGAHMVDAHLSYTACGLGTPETDLIVDLALEHAFSGHIAGAKITGGGSGGTVCFLTRRQYVRSLSTLLTEQYMAKTGITPRIITGSSDGAIHTAVATVQIV